MASSHTAIPEFLKFLDPHLCLNILNFYESFLTDEVATQTRRNFLFRTHLFKEQEEFLRKHNITDSDLLSQNEIKRKVDEKQEHDLKFRLTGFLNLIENNKKENEGGALSLSKKIVKGIFYSSDRRNPCE